MTDDNHLMLPYCPYCGAYKGVGLCSADGCPGATKEGLRAVVIHRNPPVKRMVGCAVCGRPAITRCSSCGAGYCETHSRGKESGRIESRDQNLGTCGTCGEVVCENCWVLDRGGRIVCLRHMRQNGHERF